MNDIVLKVCSNEFESSIESLFRNARKIPDTGMAEIPIIGGRFLTWVDHTHLLPNVCRALCCRERFRQDEPNWPILPLHRDDIAAAMDDDCPRYMLLGHYSDSLAMADWSYDTHPTFNRFARGLMAYKYAPPELRTNHHLQREFPPHPLAGLTDRELYWRSPEQITKDRHHNAWVNEMDARRLKGIAMQARDEWVREQVPMFVGCC
jgi:hypothetical protein